MTTEPSTAQDGPTEPPDQDVPTDHLPDAPRAQQRARAISALDAGIARARFTLRRARHAPGPVSGRSSR